MISNQILQNTIDGIKKISQVDISLTNVEGKVLATTLEDDEEIVDNKVAFLSDYPGDSFSADGFHYFKIFEEMRLEYVLILRDDRPDNFLIGRMAAYQIQSLLTAYKERFDKDNFIKNLLLDNLLLVDIYNRAKKLHIEIEKRRIVFIIENSTARDSSIMDAIMAIPGMRSYDFITAVDETNIIIVKDLEDNEGYEFCYELADRIHKKVNYAIDSNPSYVSCGTIIKELKDVSKAYKEAKMSLDVGKIFYPERDVVAYNTLGIGRLIYQLPLPLCKMFIKEIFTDETPDDFDDETIETINKFFENNLNVSETSRQLYIHRNTLVYRLDKIQKNTGLDLRVFEDAITFKIALMVVKYIKHMAILDY